MYKRGISEHSNKSGMRHGKYAEGALLGRPKTFDTGLPVEDAFNKGKLTTLLKKNLPQVMQKCREAQKDDPVWPKRPFLRKLVSDVENKLLESIELPGDLAVRIYSSVDSVLDLAGVDFWVELFDEENQKVLADYKIDLKTRPDSKAGGLADYIYYCDEEIASSEDPADIFRTPDYKDLVERTTDHLLQAQVVNKFRGNIRHIKRLEEGMSLV